MGAANHAHEYKNGNVCEHMFCHVYHEGIGNKGANNVASLIAKGLQQLNLLHKDSVRGKLNIILRKILKNCHLRKTDFK